MRIDVVTIFPEYLAPLELSLLGKAQRDGKLQIRVHDLREVTTDRHRTVDDTPFGGGAGMVMTPQPWAEALASLTGDSGAGRPRPHVIVPTPSGRPMTQALARELADEDWLAFACGRYEGIDERVFEYAAQDLGLRVSPISLGDYVLNGGEVAVLAIVEAVARLIPGVIGNAESLVEESHEGGLLEYPVYTKPASWRVGAAVREVPPVLLSGDHAAIAAWRHRQRLDRTAERRPDLLPPAGAATGLAAFERSLATRGDAGELLTLTLACRAADGCLSRSVGAGRCDDDGIGAEISEWQTWLWRSGGRLVASVRVRSDPADRLTWQIGRLLVAPDLAGRGFRRELLAHAESLAPREATSIRLDAGSPGEDDLRIHRKAGYRRTVGEGSDDGTAYLTKPLRRR